MYLAADQGLFSTEDEGKTVTALNNGLPYEKITAFELDPSDPSTLYAIVGRRLFRSSNAGREWRAIATWDLSDQETKLAIDSKHGRLLYLVTPDGSIKRSTDQGTTWKVAMPGTEHASCLAVSPSDPEILYSGSNEGNVWRSTNAGTDWHRLPGTDPSGPVLSLVVDPQDPDIVYKAGKGAGWLKSTDGGQNWTCIIGCAGTLSTLSFLFISPNSPNTLLTGSGLYRSLDGGETWDDIPRSFGKGLSTVAASPDGNTLYAAGIWRLYQSSSRLYKSGDNGLNWISTIPTIEEIGPDEIVIDPKTPDRMYILYETGASGSTDGGKSWRDFAGVPGSYLADLQVDPHDGQVLYLGVRGEGVYRSEDLGETWHPLLPLIDEKWDIWRIRPDHLRSGQIYAICNPRVNNAPPQIYRTTDGGQTWARADAGMPAGHVREFILDPGTTGTVYLGHDDGVFKTTDGGDTWRSTSLQSKENLKTLAIDPRNPNVLYCSTSDPGFFKSTDRGDNWRRIGGTGSGMPDGREVGRLVVSPHDSTVYALITYGSAIYRSTDSGSHWTVMPETFPWPTFSPNDPEVLFALKQIWPYYGGSVIKSTDGGENWYPLRYDLRFALVTGLRIDPTDSNTVFARVYQEGVYKSTDGALSWSRASDGLSLDLSAIEIDPSDHRTLLAAGDEGVFRTSDAGLSWERVSDLPMTHLAFDPRTSGLIYGIGWDRKIYKTTDRGSTWKDLAAGFPVHTLSVSYSDPNVIYAGGGVLIKSTDAGSTWTSLNWAFKPNSMSSISINPDDPSAVRVFVEYGFPFEVPPGSGYESLDGGLTWKELKQFPYSYPDPLTPNIVYSNSRISLDSGLTWLDLPTPAAKQDPRFSASEPRKAYVAERGVFAATLSEAKTSYFPQIGSGRSEIGELQTELVFMNLGPESQVDLQFVGSDGQPMPLTLDESGPQSSHSITLCAGCTATVKTKDTSALKTGYARVRTGINIHGIAVYGYSENGVQLYEAGVPAVAPLQNATVFVSRSGEAKDTGLAIANLGEEAADVTLRLYDPSFELVASTKLDQAVGQPFEAGSHVARFLRELFGAAAASVEDGIVTIESDQPLAVASLLQRRSSPAFPIGNVTLTAMPVFEGRANGASPPFNPFPRKLYVPQVGNGGAGGLQLQSSLLLTNLDRGSASVRVEFFDSAGQPMLLPLASQEMQSTITLSLGSGQSARVTTDGSGPLRAGYAVVTAWANVGVAAVYHCFDSGIPMFEAGVPAVTRHSKYALFGSVTETTDTAVALVNTGTKPAHGIIRFHDADGKSLGSRSLEGFSPFTPGAHVARYISELFPGATAENGRVVIESDQPLTGVTLRQRDDAAIAFPLEVYLLTVFPAVPAP